MSRLSRWSQRKRSGTPPGERVGREHDERVDVERDDDALEPEDTLTTEVTAPEEAPTPDPGSLDHTLPDPDSLPPGSDIKAFLAPGVSAALRRRALRRLFAADHYGVRDGLDDYDEDYRRHLKPLAGELAQRLRQWTRQVSSDDQVASEPATRETAADDQAASHPRDGEGAADGSRAITGDEKSGIRRAGESRHPTLDEGSSGENAQSDQH